MKKAINFFEPSIGKIVFTVIVALFALNFGYNACASCCSPDVFECSSACCIKYNWLFYPMFVGSDTHLTDIPFFLHLFAILWWYIVACVAIWIKDKLADIFEGKYF